MFLASYSLAFFISSLTRSISSYSVEAISLVRLATIGALDGSSKPGIAEEATSIGESARLSRALLSVLLLAIDVNEVGATSAPHTVHFVDTFISSGASDSKVTPLRLESRACFELVVYPNVDFTSFVTIFEAVIEYLGSLLDLVEVHRVRVVYVKALECNFGFLFGQHLTRISWQQLKLLHLVTGTGY